MTTIRTSDMTPIAQASLRAVQVLIRPSSTAIPSSEPT